MDWSVTLLLASLLVALTNAEGICGETRKLGMGSGEIKNASITSSSAQPGFEAHLGRLRDGQKDGAWCPASPITRNSYEWIQVDFSQMAAIVYVEIAGEFADGEGIRFARKFRIEYQRTENDTWRQYVDENDEQVFLANNNARTSEYLNAKPRLLASRVRIIPVADSRDEVCVRLEFYGCYRNGVAQYTVPQGDSMGARYNFIDSAYDGRIDNNGILSGGLGLLTNTTLGKDRFSESPFDWLGWKNGARANVKLLFEMDHLRNISEIKIHSNNQHNQDVRRFHRASVYLSRNKDLIDSVPPLVFNYTRVDSESSIEVRMSIGNKVAKYVKIILDFDAKWIMISEVDFVSQLVIGQYPEITMAATSSTETARRTTTPVVAPKTVRTTPRVTRDNVDVDTTTKAEVIVPGGNNNIPANEQNSSGIDSSLIGIIVGSCLGAILVVMLIIIVCCLYQRRKMSSNNSSGSSAGGESTISSPPAQKNQPVDMSEYDLPWGNRPLPHPPPNGTTLQSSGYSSESGAPYACIPIEQYNNGCQQQTVMPPQQPCLHHYMMGGGLLTLPGVHHDRHPCNITRPVNTLPAHAHNNLLIPFNNKGQVSFDRNQYDLVQQDSSPYDSSNYRSSPTVPLPNIQSGTGSSVYGVPANSQLEEDIPKISYDSLRFIEKLGAGQYGEVHLCQMTSIKDGGGLDKPRLVAMKKLQPAASEATKADFIREIKIMGKLRHPNIVGVIGICSSNSSTDSPCVVTEYMSKGDLNQFLQKHVPQGTNLLNKQTLDQATLIFISYQIAQAMSYLEQLNVTHRDLAARNCLVGDNYQVKISDFGMSRSLYSQQYYKVEGRVVLPIRWMAWESVLLGKFTTKSDVWSFGVTLWEIFTFAREQPFSVLPDDDVIANCMNYYHNNMVDVILLHQPSQCSKEIYDLMRACWNHDDIHRPTFKDITLFLSRRLPTSPPNHTPEREMSLTRLTTC